MTHILVSSLNNSTWIPNIQISIQNLLTQIQLECIVRHTSLGLSRPIISTSNRLHVLVDAQYQAKSFLLCSGKIFRCCCCTITRSSNHFSLNFNRNAFLNIDFIFFFAPLWKTKGIPTNWLKKKTTKKKKHKNIQQR